MMNVRWFLLEYMGDRVTDEVAAVWYLAMMHAEPAAVHGCSVLHDGGRGSLVIPGAFLTYACRQQVAITDAGGTPVVGASTLRVQQVDQAIAKVGQAYEW